MSLLLQLDETVAEPGSRVFDDDLAAAGEHFLLLSVEMALERISETLQICEPLGRRAGGVKHLVEPLEHGLMILPAGLNQLTHLIRPLESLVESGFFRLEMRAKLGPNALDQLIPRFDVHRAGPLFDE